VVKTDNQIMDNYNLNRFVIAQESSFARALKEIKSGRKTSHWMWYIFPQMKGLGTSYNSTFYGISGREEAEAYITHPVVGPRLIEISRALLTHAEKPIEQILGHTDSLKLKSCMELFASLAGADPVFKEVLKRFYA
jgi:uncharacterized protein (DUF1810 family)